jgi:hypothetical protein
MDVAHRERARLALLKISCGHEPLRFGVPVVLTPKYFHRPDAPHRALAPPIRVVDSHREGIKLFRHARPQFGFGAGFRLRLRAII